MKKTFFLIASACLFLTSFSGCLKSDDPHLPFSGIQPKDIGDGLPLTTLQVANIDEAILSDVYQDLYTDKNLWSLRSALVLRNGNLVAEAYLADEADINQSHLIWSCTKQVMGTLTGVALEQGLISSLEDPISDYLSDELAGHPEKQGITIRDLLTMRSGIDYNNGGIEGQTDQLLRQKPEDMVQFILELPMIATHGSVFHYNDGDPSLLSAIIQKQAGLPTDEWADIYVFSKLGISNYHWTRYKDGVTLGGFGIATTPRELAKWGNCILANGFSKGEQIIPADWITEMTTSQVSAAYLDFNFGYYWWLDPLRDIRFMWGHGGQFVFIHPPKGLVMIFTSIPNTQDDFEIDALEILPYVDRIIAAAQ